MNCHDLDSQVTAYLDGELVAEARVEIEEHLASCATCGRRVEVERHNHSLVRAAVKQASPQAPAQLRAAIFQHVRKDERRARRLRVGRLTAAAAAAACAMVVGNHQYRLHQLRLYEQDAALRHARQFPMEIVQPHEEALSAWFGGKLDHPVNVPRFPNAHATGARLLQVRDKQAAYIRYDAPHPMGLFVFGDDHDVDVGAEPEVGTSHGYNVVSWREGDVVYQLVTDLEERDVRELLPRGGAPGAGESGTPLPSTRPVEVRPASLQR
jgi:mycothiol system anti-sigma-R factor